ncbi:tyrosine-type recombinase/integrase [Bacillus cereus]|uniref:tyrosine-type recombinase/integrase n=1 Tax=Bacillus cereus TaxID=1396 RepID=UPI0020D24F1B|nr:tyrosine-type recombinase/integrase [Bacillus cereus]
MVLGNPKFRKNEDEIIFQNYNGHYLTPSIIRETMQDYYKKVGVEYKGTHGFRHTHAVLLLKSGASLKYVSNQLEHRTIKTTADIYLDITEKNRKRRTSKVRPLH